VISETEEDAGEDGGQNRSASDYGELERLAEQMRKTYAGRKGCTYHHDDHGTLPSTKDAELWMLRTKVRTAVMHEFVADDIASFV
jgi:hypothetical protein